MPFAASKPPAVTGEEGVASLEIATRCLEGRSTVDGALIHEGAAPGRGLTPPCPLPVKLKT